jgi:putative serine protease PepD
MSDGFHHQGATEQASAQHTQQLAAGYPYGRPPGYPAPAPEPPRRRRTGLAAAVVATSLLVGGGAGLGGAAVWDATHDDAATPAAARTSASSPVSTQGQDPAPEGSIEAVAQAVLPSVVKIDVSAGQEGASGSGIILTADGTILTNNHVVEMAENGGSLRVSFNDGSTADAEILGTDPLTDTAVIKAQDVSDLTPATIGKSANLGVGEAVVAIGSPYGLDATVTSGIVSALNRPVNVGSDDQGNSTTYPAIQTDAAINPGNSGGPLVDMTGAVVGINSSIRTAASESPFGSSQQGSIGLGFAIPIDEVMPIVDQMAAGETPTHARLGIRVGDDEDGARVVEVTDGSTAAEAGMKAGDVITSVEDHRITGADSLVATIRSYRPGDKVTVTWERGGQSQEAEVELDSDAATE